MKVLITGATGFLGSSFLDGIKNRKNIEIDIVSRSELKTNFNVLVGNLNSKTFLKKILKKDYKKIFHFAWEGLPDLSYENCAINYKLTSNLINEVSKLRNTELNIIGSCLEYGAISEKVSDYDSPKGDTHFAKTKIKLNSLLKNSQIPYKWYRPFYVYGVNQSKKSLIPSTLQAASKGIILNHKNPNSAHDFISVEDLSLAINRIAFDYDEFGEFNIGTGELTTVGEIAHEIYNYFNLNYSYNLEEKTGLCSDNKRIYNLTGWNPKYQGLVGIKEYFSNYNLLNSPKKENID
jgi:nucleoside-diphosphate-sugar epimerase